MTRLDTELIITESNFITFFQIYELLSLPSYTVYPKASGLDRNEITTKINTR